MPARARGVHIDVQPITTSIRASIRARRLQRHDPTSSLRRAASRSNTSTAFWSDQNGSLTAQASPRHGETGPSNPLALRQPRTRGRREGVGGHVQGSRAGPPHQAGFRAQLRYGHHACGEYVPALRARASSMPYDVTRAHPVPMRIAMRNRKRAHTPPICGPRSPPPTSRPRSTCRSPAALPSARGRARPLARSLNQPAEEECPVRLIYNGEVINQLRKN